MSLEITEKPKRENKFMVKQNYSLVKRTVAQPREDNRPFHERTRETIKKAFGEKK